MNEYLVRVMSYNTAMVQAKKMFSEGIIDAEDLVLIEEKLAEKYCINCKSLYRFNNLLSTSLRGNITHE